MILALYDFRENTEEAENEADAASKELDWAKLCDVQSEFHNFLYSVELVVKKMMSTKAMKEGFSMTVEKAIEEDDDVLFWWWTLCGIVDVENETAETHLHQIAEHYITVRGFTFAARWMEQYKINNHKNLQKSKGLRKKLPTD